MSAFIVVDESEIAVSCVANGISKHSVLLKKEDRFLIISIVAISAFGCSSFAL